MKLLIKTFLVILVLTGSAIHAQKFQGVATYKSHRKMDVKMGDQMNAEQQKMIQAQLQKQFQKEYTLTFNAYESIYKQEEKLDAPQPVSSGIQIKVVQGSDIMYKNIKEHRYSNKSEIYGKIFLVKDSLRTRKWEMVDETKNIGEYTCYKAVIKGEYTTKTINDKGEIEEVTKPRTTTVWYTPQIPISNGPADYFGLPGLILEVNDGQQTLICSKIVLNPKESIEINEPKKGKEVTQKEFDTIQQKKADEMMEQFRSSSRGRHNDGSRVMIQVGG